MAHYKCPIATCNVNFEGSVWDIIPQAVSHGDGSHKMNLSDSDIQKIIELEARGESADEFLPKVEVEKPKLPEPEPIVGYKATQQHNWWKR